MEEEKIDIGKYEIPSGRLRKSCFALLLKNPPTLETPIELVDQPRALSGLEFALSAKNNLHVAVVCDRDISEPIADYIKSQIAERKSRGETFPLFDLACVHNFANPEKPVIIKLPAGEARKLKETVIVALQKLSDEIPLKLSDANFRSKKEKIERRLRVAEEKEIDEFHNKLKEAGVLKELKESGWSVAKANKKGEPGFVLYIYGVIKANGDLFYGLAEFKDFIDGLGPEQREEHKEHYQKCKHSLIILEPAIQKAKDYQDEIIFKYQQEYERQIEGIRQKIIRRVVDAVFKETFANCPAEPKLKSFIQGLGQYAKDTKDLFFAWEGDDEEEEPGMEKAGEFLRSLILGEKEKREYGAFRVNILVENAPDSEPPTIIVRHPSFEELFGKVEKEIIIGALTKEKPDWHMKVKAGALHRALDGNIIINVTDIASTKLPVYIGLKQVLKEGEIRIREPANVYGHSEYGEAINPESVPLDVKVIALIHPSLYYNAWYYLYDRELMELFPVKAEFDRTIELSKDNLQSYSQWMDDYSEKEGFLRLDLQAKAGIIEFLLREAGNQKRFSWDVPAMKTVIQEAQFLAIKDGVKAIRLCHIEQAIEAKIYRSNLVEEKIRDLIKQGKIRIEVEGKKVGQVNGLTVFQPGDYFFGAPTRITATAFKGNAGIINIEKEAGLVDKSNIKGFEILKGFFYKRYGGNVNFEARIGFEDEFDEHGGPSASAAQLFALLSDLSGIPINQNTAITGTVDQEGNIGAIGKPTEKTEGFHKTIEILVESIEKLIKKDPTVNWKVVIPKANEKDLMLNKKIVSLTEKGRFSVYAIDHVSQGTKIVMDCTLEEIDKSIRRKLKKWSRRRGGQE